MRPEKDRQRIVSADNDAAEYSLLCIHVNSYPFISIHKCMENIKNGIKCVCLYKMKAKKLQQTDERAFKNDFSLLHSTFLHFSFI